jgi:hypothetical protein
MNTGRDNFAYLRRSSSRHCGVRSCTPHSSISLLLGLLCSEALCFKIILYLFATIVIFFSIPLKLSAAERDYTKEVNGKVSQLVELLNDSYSYEINRGIKIKQIGNGNQTVAVAIFSIEGFEKGNATLQYMAVFSTLGHDSVGRSEKISLIDLIKVGGRGYRYLESDKINIERKNDEIFITVPDTEYDPGKDGMCCPSIKSKVKFKIFLTFNSCLEEIVEK